jgi:O-succinylbenzoic acid--CoA ligase
VNDWLERAARRHPERVALESPERTVHYAAVLERADRLSRDLDPGAPVPVEAEDPIEFVTAVHACLRAGAPAVPVDRRLSPAERRLRSVSGTSFEDVAAVMFTSGTTSTPKAVELTHANFLASALGSAVALGLDPAERWLCPMPMSHVGGLSIPIRSAIYATTAVLHARFDVETVLEELMDPGRRITLVSLVPTMLGRLLDAGLSRPPALRWSLLGGGPIPPGLLDRASRADVPVAWTYGMTEACSQIATFGLPLAGVDVRLSEAEDEILVRGPIVAPGSVSEDGELHTGDLGRFEDGRLVIVGRKAETIVTGGENVAPAEVEAILMEHPDVADAGVFGREDPEWGEAVVARVVLRDGGSASEEALRGWCRERVARYKVPKAVEFAAELPRTASGKLLRRELTRSSP